jgi:hypothetical protein
MNEEKELKPHLPPFREEYELSEQNQRVINRFKEELEHRIQIPVCIKVYKENYLAYPSLHRDLVKFEITVGNWHRVSSVSEFEIDSVVGGSFFYFCPRLVDDIMAALLRIGASRA